MKKYTLLIDESGDQGLDNLVTTENPHGASAYMTMGAALVYTDHLTQLRENLESERALLDVKRLHCADLDHAKLAYLSRKVSEYRLKLFGVISRKSTLGTYRELITGDDQAQDYYNKCSQYLLERIGSFFDEKQIQGKDVDIIFETKRNHDYFRLQRFLRSICRKPLDPRAAKLQHLDPIIISNKDKNEEPCLFLADLTAYSLLRAFYPEGNKLKISEQRYLRELKNAFHRSNKTGQIANHGIKFIKGPVNMGLKDREYEFAMKFYKAKEA